MMSEDRGATRASPGLHGQHVVIIGGSSGVAYEAADRALAEGARVTIASNNGPRITAALKRLGGCAHGGIVDVHEEASVAAFFRGLATFDHLVYMIADSGPHRLSASLALRDSVAAADALKVTGWSALTAIKYAQSRLSPGGSITLTDRILRNHPGTRSVSPGVFDHLTRGLAVDLAPVRVNGVRSSGTASEPGARTAPGRQAHRLLIPRWAEPVEIAQAYLYLLRGSYTTGQVLVVDGGLTLL